MHVFHSKNKIFSIRSRRVMLAPDLAELYNVETKALNQAVERNKKRFPAEFMFRLTAAEKKEMVADCSYAFTERGALMLANVLKSKEAIAVSIFVIRAYIKLRDLGYTHHALSSKLEELENHIEIPDAKTRLIFEAIHQLMKSPKQDTAISG